jgi:phage FluMu gp28-like protein
MWRQEFLCEFVDELTAFLTYERIQECEDQKLPRELDVAALEDHKGDVVVGVDIGRKHDLTVVWAFDLIGSQLISRGLIELTATRFRDQFELLSKVLANRCVRRCCVDSTGLGMQLAEELRELFGGHLVEECTFTAAFKSQIAGALRVKVEDKNIRIPVDPDIRNDLHSVSRGVTAAGNVRFEAPREEGSHADRFYAAALAVHAADNAGGAMDAMFGRPLSLARGGIW